MRRHDACYYLIQTDIDSILDDTPKVDSRRLEEEGQDQQSKDYLPDSIKSLKFPDSGLDINLSLERMLTVKITKSKGMNVYLYEGMNRFEATKTVIEGNHP